jgi:hypothetical protein
MYMFVKCNAGKRLPRPPQGTLGKRLKLKMCKIVKIGLQKVFLGEDPPDPPKLDPNTLPGA